MMPPAPKILRRCLAGRTLPYALGLGAANLLAWGWALLAFGDRPMLLGTALLAYGLGLRHAVDADHIAAIDNATRKLLQQGRRSASVGLFFSLGHSSVVLLATLGLALTAGAFPGAVAALERIGGAFGTLTAAGFLLVIAAINAAALRDTWRSLRRGEAGPGGAPGGLLVMLLRRALRLIGRGWHMYPLGFLFGLGFDTASEVALLGLSASQSAHGLPLGSLLVLPVLFTAGMSLVDTADGLLMLHAYGWAFARPRGRLYYNLVVTAASVALALLIGGVEVLQLAGERFGLQGGVFGWAEAAGAQFAVAGVLIIGLFAALWGGAVLLSRTAMRAGG